MINGVILGGPTINSRYGAEINRLTDDSNGRHQVEVVIRLVNTTLIHNGSNVSCAVGSELRRVYILYYISDSGMYEICIKVHIMHIGLEF
jgi:hypothetical protein